MMMIMMTVTIIVLSFCFSQPVALWSRSKERLPDISFVHVFTHIRQDQSDAITVKTASGALFDNIRKTELRIETAMEKMCLFESRLKVGTVGADVTECGRAFQVRAAATGNARSLSVEQWVAGTISCDRTRHQLWFRTLTLSYQCVSYLKGL